MDKADGDSWSVAEDRMRRVVYLEDVDSHLSWDQKVMMPGGGKEARANERAEISTVVHETLSGDAIGAALDRIDPESLGPDERANFRELRRRHDRVVSVPKALEHKQAVVSSKAQAVWEDAKAANDFDAFADILDELRELRTKRATHIDPNGDPYESMYDERMPTLPLATARELLEEITPPIKELLAEIRETGNTLANPFDGQTVPETTQVVLSEAVLQEFENDWEHSRLDTSAHPFTAGNQYDTRFTTRYLPDDVLDGFTATLHEYGHATYNLGLPRDAYGTFVGTDRREVHESQSRFWENHVGRSKAFWDRFAPVFQEHLADDSLDAQTMYEAVNRVQPDNVIRVNADELTYHLHIRVRADIEREFVEGTIDVEEIPRRWDELMDRHLGVTPDSDQDGPLQDSHWTDRFGGFQSYTVGSVIAAQLEAAMREDVDVEGCIRDGAYDTLREWMTEHVHRYGCRYETPELVERATGDPPKAEPFIEYIRTKYRPLYGL